jgi:hypothetical protein
MMGQKESVSNMNGESIRAERIMWCLFVGRMG